MGVHCGRNCESKREAALYGSGIQCNVTGRNFPKRGKAPAVRRKVQRSSPRMKSAPGAGRSVSRHAQAKASVRRGIYRAVLTREIKKRVYLQNRSKYGLADGRWLYRGRYISDVKVRRAHGL